MTPELIEKWARDEGLFTLDHDAIDRFAHRIAEHVSEQAAQICDRLVTALDHGGNAYRREATASQCAGAIRAAMPPVSPRPAEESN